MKINSAELTIIQLQLLRPFETSFGVETGRTIPILALRSQGVEGYSEGVMDPLPLFREETLAGAMALVRETFLPLILGADLPSPASVNDRLAPFRGNRMAKALVEMAAWDLWARLAGQPLMELLGGVRQAIPVGVSLGIQKSIEATLALVGAHLDQGYRRIKLKIKPGWDVALIAKVREAFPGADLTVDANSSYRLEDLATLQALDQYGLDYIEQPLAYDDIIDHARLQAQLQDPPVPGRIDPLGGGCSQGAGDRGLPGDQHQGGPGWRARRSKKRPRHGPNLRRAGLVRGDAGERDRKGPQHPPGDLAQFQQARRHQLQQPLLGPGHHQRAARSQGWPDAGPAWPGHRCDPQPGVPPDGHPAARGIPA